MISATNRKMNDQHQDELSIEKTNKSNETLSACINWSALQLNYCNSYKNPSTSLLDYNLNKQKKT